MVAAALRHRQAEDDSHDPIGRNINLECALLHARNLIEFLATRPRSDDYMRPEHFAPGWDRSKWAHLAKELGALNAHLAHLDWKRLDPAAPKLTRGIFRDILEACRSFAGHLTDSGCVGGQPINVVLDEAETMAQPMVVTSFEDSTPAFSTGDSLLSTAGLRDPLELNL